MRLLLDSHAALWVFEGSPNLPERTRQILSTPGAAICFSPASTYEITFKAQIGKIPPLPQPFGTLAAASGLEELPILAAHADLAARLATIHRDPWDRLIAAQGIVEGIAVVTRDPAIGELGAAVVW